MFGPILSMLFDYVEFIINLFMVVCFMVFMVLASCFMIWLIFFFMNIVWMFKLNLFDTHFGFLLMPKGERNGIKSRIHMSNQLIFKININSKTKGENL